MTDIKIDVVSLLDECERVLLSVQLGLRNNKDISKEVRKALKIVRGI